MQLTTCVENLFKIYRNNAGELKAVVLGNRVDYFDLPSNLREPYQAELIADSQAQKCLQSMNIFDADAMEYKFVACRHGHSDLISDTSDHKIIPDAPCCSEIKTCPGFNIICKVPAGKNGTLSRQEYLIVSLVSIGKLDKEIAYELGIEISTTRTHLARIREKLCVNNRIEIAFWAMKKGIVCFQI